MLKLQVKDELVYCPRSRIRLHVYRCGECKYFKKASFVTQKVYCFYESSSLSFR